MLAVAPPGLNQVFPMMCGTCANENGIKIVFMRYMHNQRHGRTAFTPQVLVIPIPGIKLQTCISYISVNFY